MLELQNLVWELPDGGSIINGISCKLGSRLTVITGPHGGGLRPAGPCRDLRAAPACLLVPRGHAFWDKESIPLAELREAEVDMFCTVFIGNSAAKTVAGQLITPRGYRNV